MGEWDVVDTPTATTSEWEVVDTPKASEWDVVDAKPVGEWDVVDQPEQGQTPALFNTADTGEEAAAAAETGPLLGEAVPAMITGIPGFVGGTILKHQLASEKAAEGEDKPFSEASKQVNEILSQVTYQPKTEAGAAVTKGLTYGLIGATAPYLLPLLGVNEALDTETAKKYLTEEQIAKLQTAADTLMLVAPGVRQAFKGKPATPVDATGKTDWNAYLDQVAKESTPEAVNGKPVTPVPEPDLTGYEPSAKAVEMAQKPEPGVPAETVTAGELRPGDSFTRNGEQFKVEDVTPYGTVKVKDGVKIDLPPDQTILADQGSVKLKSPEVEAIPEMKPEEISAEGMKEPSAEVKPAEAAPQETGILKESTLSVRAEADAIAKKLTEDFGELPEYKTMNMKEQAERAKSVMDSNYEQAKRMAMGEEIPPAGIREATMFEAVKLRALKEGDVDTLRRLATESTVPGKLSEYGQAIKAADSGIMDDPVRAIQDVSAARAERAKRTGNAESEKQIDDLKRQLEEATKKLDTYEEGTSTRRTQKVIDGIREELSRESRREQREISKAELASEFDALLKEFGEIANPAKLNAGLDPAMVPVLLKMARNRVRSGMVTVEGVIDSIFNAIKDRVIVSKREIKDALAEYWQTMKTPEERSLKSYKTRLTNEATKLEQKLKEGDFVKTEKKHVELDAYGKKLKSERDRIKKDYQNAMKAGVSKEESAEIVRLSQITAEKRAELDKGGNRFEYGSARVAYENYVNDLKGANAPIRSMLKDRAAEFKTTWRDNKAKAVWEGTKDTLKTITDNSIAMVASFDNSFIGRQGLKTLMTHPSAWWPAAKKSFADFAHTIGGKNAHDALNADVYSRPNYLNGEYQKAKIITRTEEQYPTTLPERVPVLGRVFKASEVAFTGSALRMRTDLYDMLSTKAKENGVDMGNKVHAESLGKMINALTARGQWGQRGESPVVRLVLWAPKMLKGNIDVLTAHTFGAGLESAFARKEAAINLLKIVGETATVMMIANALVPDSAETDPRSADFGKIKIGDTRFDITGGAGSIVVLASRIATGESKSTSTGLVVPYGIGYGKRSPFDALIDFLNNKTTPPAGVVASWLKGKNREGEPFSVSDAAYRAFTPISMQNFINAKDDASADKIAGAIVDLVGINANSYSDDRNNRSDIVDRMRKGKPLTELQKEFFNKMTPTQKSNIRKESRIDATKVGFSKLSVQDAISAWESASEENQRTLRSAMMLKISNAKIPPQEKRELRMKIRTQ